MRPSSSTTRTCPNRSARAGDAHATDKQSPRKMGTIKPAFRHPLRMENFIPSHSTPKPNQPRVSHIRDLMVRIFFPRRSQCFCLVRGQKGVLSPLNQPNRETRRKKEVVSAPAVAGIRICRRSGDPGDPERPDPGPWRKARASGPELFGDHVQLGRMLTGRLELHGLYAQKRTTKLSNQTLVLGIHEQLGHK